MEGVLLTGQSIACSKRSHPNFAIEGTHMSKEPDVAGALAAIRSTSGGRGRGNRSGVYEWLFARYEQLAKGFEETPPGWKALAAYLAEHGIKGADNKPPTAVSTRSAWLRVVQMKTKRNAKKAEAEPAPVQPDQTRLNAPPPPADQPIPPSDSKESREAAKARFRANFKPIRKRTDE